MNSWNDAKEVYDPETASSSGVSHVPSQPFNIPSPRGMISRLIHESHWVPQETFLKVYLLRMGRLQHFSIIQKNLASSSCGFRQSDTSRIMEQRGGVRREPQGSTTPTPGFVRVSDPLYRTGRTYCQNPMMENSRHPIKELYRLNGVLENHFKTEVCANSLCPTIKKLWIKVEVSKNNRRSNDVAIN